MQKREGLGNLQIKPGKTKDEMQKLLDSHYECI